MNYEPDDFLALLEEVERKGGAHLSVPCIPHEYKIKLPDASGRMRSRRSFTASCGKDAMFAVPYEPVARSPEEKKSMLERGAGFATVCAVDDDLGRWPRYAHVITQSIEEDAQDAD